jgi:hypothetical protein
LDAQQASIAPGSQLVFPESGQPSQRGSNAGPLARNALFYIAREGSEKLRKIGINSFGLCIN